jgi:hypothetical protein
MMWIKASLSLFVLGLLSGCAHSYFYLPEITGKGAIYGNGGIVYSVPPESPALKMKIVSVGTNDKGEMLIRMYFVRSAKPSTLETMDPKEQTLVLNKMELQPIRVHANTKKKPLIELAEENKQAVELVYQLPRGRTEKNVENFLLRWKIGYGVNQTEEQTARFDRHDSAPQQGSDDSDFPYDDNPAFQNASNWLPIGWDWF